MLNLNDVRMFVHVIEQGGFAPAARALRVPKSTLSKRVAALEAELQVVLIQRTTRSFTVTPIGREFQRHAYAMVELAAEAEHAVRGSLAEPSGPVAVTCSVPTAQTWLAALLPKVAKKHPALRITLHVTDRLVDIVRDGFDIAVRDHFGPLPDSSLIQRRVATDAMVLVASPAYLHARKVPRAPKDLVRHDVLLTHAKVKTWKLRHDDGSAIVVPVSSRFAADEAVALLAAAKAGLGITMLPSRACATELKAGALRRVLPGWTSEQVTTTLLLPDRRAQLPSVRAVSDAIAAAAND